MKTFLIVAMTADGKIAKHKDHLASWTSKEDKKFFVERTKTAGVLIMGQTTYETIGKAMPGRLTVVYSKKTYPGVETTTKDPAELLKDLEARGYNEVAICGGSTIYTMFMKAKLIDTLYITVEPLLFGEGLSIFNEPLDVTLKLETFKPLNDKGTLLLEYACHY